MLSPEDPGPAAEPLAPPAPPPPVETTAAETEGFFTAPVASEHEQPGAHRHDGFYLRIGLGFTAFGDSIRGKGATDDEYRKAGAFSGMATSTALAIGGTVSKGLVLGGGIWGLNILATDFYPDNDSNVTLSNVANPAGASLTMLGPFIDYYPNETRGFHIQGSLAVAVLTGFQYDVGRFEDRTASFGGGATLGLGYEWWTGDEWSVGVLAQGTAAIVLEGEDERDVQWLHAIVAVPALMFTLTYH